MQRNDDSIIYWESMLVPKHIMAQHQELIDRIEKEGLQGHGLNCKKLTGSNNLYRIKTNKKGRLLFANMVENEQCILCFCERLI